MSLTDLMGVDEARRALGVTREGVHHFIRKGALSPIGRIGKRGTYVFAADDVNDLVRERAADDAL